MHELINESYKYQIYNKANFLLFKKKYFIMKTLLLQHNIL